MQHKGNDLGELILSLDIKKYKGGVETGVNWRSQASSKGAASQT